MIMKRIAYFSEFVEKKKNGIVVSYPLYRDKEMDLINIIEIKESIAVIAAEAPIENKHRSCQ